MLIVKKFGGTSVANKERIYNVANRCVEEYKKGNDCISFEPRHGAICIYRLLPVGHESLEGTSLEDTNIDRWHYLLGNYNYSTWTQLGVESSGLKDACLQNDHDRIFSILQEFYNLHQGE